MTPLAWHCLHHSEFDTAYGIGKFVCWCGGLLGVLDAAVVCSVIPGFAPSGDSLFFELRKEK
ncbi:hypothetical protein OU800_23645 [Pseudomonas sp. GOM7]|uniref:hypothetical protein n=1 Tax=Pseudomonas sp. GOM7 TaxID=2998079 RepID=UPI00227D3AF4|nr:hypothetical protein [Pseudomonas sp. GOM7]WAJ37555.1 hypothetical protein OU800_23645 [Pseudomonas sp. GOM7]